ncbi:uncharacterized protein LOC111355730 [Spodoptera litura]|uniref:Uncharacterized protein LOC111355730 n=1 Tax=Spodoptera litura TaxID=69820 RepID=A0A9J7EBA5_SPOLT|nr:uncharacterized protein LOC111355730 [Spodoptera litura]
MMAFGLFLLVVQISLLGSNNGTPLGASLDIDVPEECKGQGFCAVRPQGYDAIEKRLNDILPRHNMIDFHTRSSESTNPDENADNCPSIVTTKSVYIYGHNPEEVDIIVQTKLIPQQITEVKCAYDQMENGDECFANLGLSNLGMKSSCQEHIAERSLLVYDPRIDKVKMKNYNITVCCSCHVTNQS